MQRVELFLRKVRQVGCGSGLSLREEGRGVLLLSFEQVGIARPAAIGGAGRGSHTPRLAA
jgi:hypothetical protein